MAVRRSARNASSTATPQPDDTQAASHDTKDTDVTMDDASAAAPASSAGPTTSKPLKGCAICLSGNFVSYGHNTASMKQLVSDLGGSLTSSVTKATTHVVVPENQSHNNSATKAHASGIHVLDPKWVIECQAAKQHLPEKQYDWYNDDDKDDQADSQPAADGASGQSTEAGNGAKRTHAAPDSDDDTKKPQPKKTKAVPKSKTKADPEPVKTEPADDEPVADGQVLKKKDQAIPIDEFCPLSGYQIYVDPDTAMIYDASLNQSNSGRNNNKFYRDQIVFNPKTADYKTWTRWGRVGDVGQNALLGDGSKADAIKHFEKKFKDKSGLKWEDRGNNPKPGKYAFVERSYEPDSESDDEADAMTGVKKEESEEQVKVECTLEKPIQDLVGLIFNQTYFNDTMASLNYDANKLPLGKLGKNTILRGFQQLKDLSEILDDATVAQSKHGMPVGEAIEHLSNTYYSLIPHNFGRNRPPVINTDTMLKKELELLESLSDMKDAADIMKIDRKEGPKVHPLDRHFQGLNLQEITTLDHKSTEFTMLEKYLKGTQGSTHSHFSYEVQEIFRIERPGEHDRFEKSKFSKISSDRRLLWHGSRVTNFGGILSQGLRIAPPEAPVNGYMFGKGVYLADMSSKSAGYCCSYNTGGNALLLLCDAELGDPMQRLQDADYEAGEKAIKAGMVATHGLGDMAPSEWIDAGVVNENLKGVKMPDPNVPVKENDRTNSLYYNEYIAYDVAQIRLRYLFRVKM